MYSSNAPPPRGGGPPLSASPMNPVPPPSKKYRAVGSTAPPPTSASGGAVGDNVTDAADEAIARRRAELRRLQRMRGAAGLPPGSSARAGAGEIGGGGGSGNAVLDRARQRLGAVAGGAPMSGAGPPVTAPPTQDAGPRRTSDIYPGVMKRQPAAGDRTGPAAGGASGGPPVGGGPPKSESAGPPNGGPPAGGSSTPYSGGYYANLGRSGGGAAAAPSGRPSAAVSRAAASLGGPPAGMGMFDPSQASGAKTTANKTEPASAAKPAMSTSSATPLPTKQRSAAIDSAYESGPEEMLVTPRDPPPFQPSAGASASPPMARRLEGALAGAAAGPAAATGPTGGLPGSIRRKPTSPPPRGGAGGGPPAPVNTPPEKSAPPMASATAPPPTAVAGNAQTPAEFREADRAPGRKARSGIPVPGATSTSPNDSAAGEAKNQQQPNSGGRREMLAGMMMAADSPRVVLPGTGAAGAGAAKARRSAPPARSRPAPPPRGGGRSSSKPAAEVSFQPGADVATGPPTGETAELRLVKELNRAVKDNTTNLKQNAKLNDEIAALKSGKKPPTQQSEHVRFAAGVVPPIGKLQREVTPFYPDGHSPPKGAPPGYLQPDIDEKRVSLDPLLAAKPDTVTHMDRRETPHFSAMDGPAYEAAGAEKHAHLDPAASARPDKMTLMDRRATPMPETGEVKSAWNVDRGSAAGEAKKSVKMAPDVNTARPERMTQYDHRQTPHGKEMPGEKTVKMAPDVNTDRPERMTQYDRRQTPHGKEMPGAAAGVKFRGGDDDDEADLIDKFDGAAKKKKVSMAADVRGGSRPASIGRQRTPYHPPRGFGEAAVDAGVSPPASLSVLSPFVGRSTTPVRDRGGSHGSGVGGESQGSVGTMTDQGQGHAPGAYGRKRVQTPMPKRRPPAAADDAGSGYDADDDAPDEHGGGALRPLTDEEWTLYADAARCVPAEYTSELASYQIRAPYVAPHEHFPEARQFWDFHGIAPSESYVHAADVRDRSTLELVATVEADGSVMVLHGNASMRHGHGGREEENVNVREIDDVDGMDGPIGCVMYIDVDGSEREYWLDAIYEEAQASRDAYCASLMSAADALRARPTAPTPARPGHVSPTQEVVPPPGGIPHVPTSDACVGTTQVEMPPSGNDGPPPDQGQEKPRPKPDPREEEQQHETVGMGDVLAHFVSFVCSTLFGVVYTILVGIPLRIVTTAIVLVGAALFVALLWMVVADDGGALAMGAGIDFGYNMPGIF